MTKVRANADCDNSPKSRVLRELTIAMARGEEHAVRQLVTDGIEWVYIGRKPVVGVDAFCKAFPRYGPASALTIEHVMSHGKSGAVDGVIEFGEKRRAFCNVYEFAGTEGAKVKAVTSYSIPLK